MASGAGEHAMGGAVVSIGSISIEVLGGVRLVNRGVTSDLPAGARTVLALLAFHAGAERRDGELIDLIWPGEPPLDPRRELRRQMRPLRQELGVLLVRRAGAWGLAIASEQLDQWWFESLIDRAERDLIDGRTAEARRHLSAALGLWRGLPYLELAHWPGAHFQVARLQERRLDAIEHEVALRLHASRFDPALTADLRALVRDHPQRERLWRELATALHVSGQRTAALRALDECRLALRRAGTVPSEHLARLESLLYRDAADLLAFEAIA